MYKIGWKLWIKRLLFTPPKTLDLHPVESLLGFDKDSRLFLFLPLFSQKLSNHFPFFFFVSFSIVIYNLTYFVQSRNVSTILCPFTLEGILYSNLVQCAVMSHKRTLRTNEKKRIGYGNMIKEFSYSRAKETHRRDIFLCRHIAFRTPCDCLA